jgi:hypothetical protein
LNGWKSLAADEYSGFVELFGWQHSGNRWQHVAGFRLSVPQKLYKMSHLKGNGRNMGGKNINCRTRLK